MGQHKVSFIIRYTSSKHIHLNLPIQGNLHAIGGFLLVKKGEKSRDKRIPTAMLTTVSLGGHTVLIILIEVQDWIR